MRKNKLKTFLLAVIGISSFACVTLHAQNVTEPKMTLYDFKDQSMIYSLSDNGQWAVSYGTSPTDASRYTNARRTNVKTKESDILGLDGDETIPLQCQANDVADDGTVVGAYHDQPAIWTKAGGWKYLPIPKGWTTGFASAVTPDGHYAVGRMFSYSGNAENYGEYPMLWDLTTMQITETPGYPTVGSAGEKARMIRYDAISSDSRYITGIVDFSYTWNTLHFIYDRQNESYTTMGFNTDGTDNTAAARRGLTPGCGGWGRTRMFFEACGLRYKFRCAIFLSGRCS